MKNLFKRLSKSKGFTLLECIIAIAVFAALTLVVMAMLTYARNEAVNANQTEEDLTKLIENVVSDDTQRKWNGDSEVLSLTVGGDSNTFDISYNIIDGYKNFIICPICSYKADNTVFMGVTKQENFIQTTQYVCPKDETHIFASDLKCEECGKTGIHTDTTSFKYIPSTGGYYCLECGSSNVRDPIAKEQIIAEENLSINGMVANALVYGKIEPNNPTDTTAFQKLVTVSNVVYDSTTGARQEQSIAPENQKDAAISVSSIKYESSKDQIVPGTYTMIVQGTGNGSCFDNDGDGGYSVMLELPPYYRIKVLTETTGDDVNFKHVTCSDQDDAAIGKNGWIKFDFTRYVNTIEVKFQLTNYKSGYSFDYDYNSPDTVGQNTTLNKHGLIGYWFGQQARVQGSYPGDSVYPEVVTMQSPFTITKTEG